jgi:molecular chaperone GrpE (heat shock protein)
VREPSEGVVSVRGEQFEEVAGANAQVGQLIDEQGGAASNDDAGESPAPGHLERLVELTGDLAEQTRAHHVRAAAREKVIEDLHDEVQRLRVGERSLVLKPVVVDLQTLRNDLLRQASTVPGEMSGRQVADLLESFALSVEQTLERCGSTPIRPEPGTPFSARDHRAVKVVEAASKDEDATIAEVVADGYYDANLDRVTTPARVNVRKWQDTETGTQQQEKGEDGV